MISSHRAWVAAAIAGLLLVSVRSGAADSILVDIPGGDATVGIKSEESRPEQYGPTTLVAPFAIDRLEVTVRDYLACTAAKACALPAVVPKMCNAAQVPRRLDHPMNCVKWGDAAAYCKWKGERLPTSVEWERAARGDTKRAFPWGDGELKDQLCWDHETKGTGHTCPVGTHPAGASPFGVLDMAGNVAEWTSTRAVAATGTWYIIRGGGFVIDEMELAEPEELPFRTRIESQAQATSVNRDLGFRCVKASTPAPESEGPSVGPVLPSAPGGTDRKAVLDAVRAGTNLTAQFKVDWLKLAGDWAYFEGKEHRSAPPPPASVHALLRRNEDGTWNTEVVLVETPEQPESRKADFQKRLHAEIEQAKLPAALFPPPSP